MMKFIEKAKGEGNSSIASCIAGFRALHIGYGRARYLAAGLGADAAAMMANSPKIVTALIMRLFMISSFVFQHMAFSIPTARTIIGSAISVMTKF
jgi:hypothetical protein